MNITITIPENDVPAWQHRVDQYNAGTGLAPVSIAEFCQLMHDEETARHVAALDAAQRAQLAADAELIELGKRVAAASPEKKAAAIAAAEAALV